MRKDWIRVARGYAQDVIAGQIVAGRWVKRACELTERDFETAEGSYYFDAQEAQGACKFLSSLTYVEDGIFTSAGEPFVLQPWQAWIVVNLFGWRWKDTGERRFRRAFLFVATGNGKSTFVAGVALYAMFCEGVRGGQGCCAASNKDQARLVLDIARKMVSADEELQETIGLDVTANTVIQRERNSKLWALPAKAKSVEGLAINLGVLDEVHAARGRELYDVLSSRCSKKPNSLFLLVSTAGDDEAGIAAEILSFLEKLLDGEADDPSFFGALYAIDKDDHWDDENVWMKANPSLGVTVDLRSMREEAHRAHQMPGTRANFLMKHLNVFVQGGAASHCLSQKDIQRCFEKSLREGPFLGTPCVVAADLASRLDLCAVIRLHSRRIDGKVHYYAFCKCWLPEARRTATPGYAQWEADGELEFTDSPTTDLDVVEEYVFSLMDGFVVRDVSFDPIQASQMMTHLERRKAGITLEIAQSAKNMTPGLNELEAAVADGRLHTNSRILLWALANLRWKEIGSSFRQPVRPEDISKKIDPAVALTMALRSAALKGLDETAAAPRIFVLDDNGAMDLPQAQAVADTPSAPLAPEPDRPGFMRVRILSTGIVKWLQDAAAKSLIQWGTAEPV